MQIKTKACVQCFSHLGSGNDFLLWVWRKENSELACAKFPPKWNCLFVLKNCELTFSLKKKQKKKKKKIKCTGFTSEHENQKGCSLHGTMHQHLLGALCPKANSSKLGRVSFFFPETILRVACTLTASVQIFRGMSSDAIILLVSNKQNRKKTIWANRLAFWPDGNQNLQATKPEDVGTNGTVFIWLHCTSQLSLPSPLSSFLRQLIFLFSAPELSCKKILGLYFRLQVQMSNKTHLRYFWKCLTPKNKKTLESALRPRAHCCDSLKRICAEFTESEGYTGVIVWRESVLNLQSEGYTGVSLKRICAEFTESEGYTGVSLKRICAELAESEGHTGVAVWRESN